MFDYFNDACSKFSLVMIGAFIVCAIWKKLDPSGYKEHQDTAKRRRKMAFGIGMKMAKRYGRGKGWF